MAKTLVIVVHPELAGGSRIHKRLTEELRKYHDVTVHDLCAAYPSGVIDTAAEQLLLEAHERVIFQFPFWWYSAPYLLKKWTDEVFAFGWAYGPGGNKLHGKELGLAISTGSTADAYTPEGYNRFDMMEMTRPYQATSGLIGMTFLPLFAIHGTFELGNEELERLAKAYAAYVQEPAVQIH